MSDKPNLSVYFDVTMHKLSETPFGIFSIYVILTISYLRAQTILIGSFVLFAPLVIGQSENDSDSQLEIAQSWLFR